MPFDSLRSRPSPERVRYPALSRGVNTPDGKLSDTQLSGRNAEVDHQLRSSVISLDILQVFFSSSLQFALSVAVLSGATSQRLNAVPE